MHIAIIHYRLLQNGGLETRLFNYLEQFRKMGHQVTLVVSKIDPNVKLDDDIKVIQVNLKRVPKPVRMYFFDNALASIIPNGKFDLSFSLGRTSNQNVVLCPGNHLGYLKAMEKRFWSPIDRLNIFLDRKAYRKSKLILACSEMMKEELVDLYKVDDAKIEVLLPPINVNKFHPVDDTTRLDLRTKFGLDPEKKSLLFLTTGNERKGYPFLLKLMATLVDKPIELIVAGVKAMPTELPNVKYVGYAEDPSELLCAADALIHPAKYEPFGQVITESIQCGTPVIISDMVGAKQIVTDNVGRVVPGFDLGDWQITIERVLGKSWKLNPDFAQDNGLTVEQHCEKIVAYSEQLK